MCDRFPPKFYVQTSYKPSNYVLGIILVVNTTFPRATYHTIVPSTEDLYCLNVVKASFHMIATIALITAIAGKNVQQLLRSYGNHSSAIIVKHCDR